MSVMSLFIWIVVGFLTLLIAFNSSSSFLTCIVPSGDKLLVFVISSIQAANSEEINTTVSMTINNLFLWVLL